MKIRKAVLKDAAVVTDFNLELAHESKDPSKGIYFLAECRTPEGKKEVIGQLMITLEWSDWRNGTFWWIQSVYVRKEFRGQGAFRALYGHVLRLARKQGNVCSLRLYVEKENKLAFRAYEKLGMKEMYYRIFDYPIFGGSAG